MQGNHVLTDRAIESFQERGRDPLQRNQLFHSEDRPSGHGDQTASLALFDSLSVTEPWIRHDLRFFGPSTPFWLDEVGSIAQCVQCWPISVSFCSCSPGCLAPAKLCSSSRSIFFAETPLIISLSAVLACLQARVTQRWTVVGWMPSMRATASRHNPSRP